eukprot:366258-Chlamydomonas_euryale.AAC.2
MERLGKSVSCANACPYPSHPNRTPRIQAIQIACPRSEQHLHHGACAHADAAVPETKPPSATSDSAVGHGHCNTKRHPSRAACHACGKRNAYGAEECMCLKCKMAVYCSR